MPAATPVSERRPHRRWWILAILGLGLLSLVGVLVLLPYVVSLERVRGPIIAQVEAALQRQVEVGAVHLQILSGLGVGLQDLTVYNPPGWQHPHVIKAGSLSVKIAWWPLLHRRLQITSLQLRNGQMILERDAQGRMNVGDLTASPSAVPPTSTAPLPKRQTSEPEQHPLARLLVSELALRGMDVTFVDRQIVPGQETTTTLGDVQLTVSDIAPGGPIPLVMTATWLTDRRENIRLRGTLGPIPASLTIEQVPFQLHLQAAEVLLSKLTPYVGAAFPPIQGRLGADLDIHGSLDHSVRLHGSLSLMQVEIRQAEGQGPPIPLPPLQSTYDFSVDFANHRAELTDIRATLAGLQTRLKGAIEQLMTKPRLDLQISTNTFAPGELLTQAPALRILLPAPLDLRGNVQLQATLKGSADDLRSEAHIELQEMILRSGALPSGPPEAGEVILETDQAQATLALHLVAAHPADLRLDARLQRGSVDYHSHTPAAAGKAVSPGSTPPSSAPQAPPTTALLPPVTLHGTVSIAEGRVQRARARQLGIEFSLRDGQLTSTQQMQLYAGSYEGKARVDLTQHEPTFALDGVVAGLDVGQALAELTPDRQTLRGVLSTDVHATGSGWAWEGIRQTLYAHGHAKITQATLRHLDPLPELVRSLQKLGERVGIIIDAQLDHDPFKTIESDWQIRQERIMTERLRLRGEGVEAVLDGSVGFDHSIDYTGKVFVPPKFVALRGRPSFLPQDNQGRLALPFTVKGTLMAPRVAVSEKALIGVVRQELLEKLRKRSGGRLEGLLGSPRSAEEPQRDPDQTQPESGDQPKRPNLPRRLLEEFLRR